MDKDTLMYYANIMLTDAGDFMSACNPEGDIPDAAFRRALNGQLDAIRADIANLQSLIDG